MTKRIVNGQPVQMTPAEEAAFEASRLPTLPQAKRDARERIASRRDVAETGGFTYATKRYGSRALDLARLSILASRARTAKAEAASITYRAVALDDTETALNADELIAMEPQSSQSTLRSAGRDPHS